MRAGRMLSLSFSLLFVFVTFLLARRREADQTSAWVAGFIAAASPLVSEQVATALSDIPSAALFWAGVLSMLVAREKRSLPLWLCTGILWGLSVLSKTTALALCAAFIATTILYGIRRHWSRKAWLAMAAGLALPGYAVYHYWNAVRSPFPWRHFLYGWAGAYYAELGRSSRLPTVLHLNWFGILLTLVFVAALISKLSPSSRVVTSWLLVGVGLWAAVARLSSPAGLREYDPGRLDSLIAGVPAIIAVTALALALARTEAQAPDRLETELLSVAAVYFAAWLLKLSYDRRFLVAVLPPVAVVVARWLTSAARAAANRSSLTLATAVLVTFAAIAWEGARRMDRGYPIFSRHILQTNLHNGLSPEAKMEEIFGPSMRIVAEVQEMIASNPELRIVAPDTRLPFFFGRNVDASYPTPATIGNYDLLMWVNNTGVIQQYRMVHGIQDPLDALKKTGRLTEIEKTPEYELYRIFRQ
jgi:Dolichyl-phosphate-mannose-protein mannosyltransferase